MKKLALIILAVATISSCTSKKAPVAAVESRPLTKTEAAKVATIELTEEFTSEIEPYKQNQITPAAQGVHIARIFVEVGDNVRAGQVLVNLDPTQYNQAMVQLKTVEDDYNRLLPVFEAGGISAQQIQQAKAQLDVQKEVVANLKKNIEVRSPISGLVTARNYESGDLFAQQPILQIMQIDPLKIMVNISEQYFASVKVGMPVSMKVDIFADKLFEGHVSLIYPALDAATRTFKVEVKIPNTDRQLRPGMYARTSFNMGKKQGVMAPDVAIQKQVGSAERYLYVIRDSVAERRAVKIGRQVGSQIDILSGVEPGEQIATTGLSRLFDGAKVEVKN